jgi:parallel beta-helix repeat protein
VVLDPGRFEIRNQLSLDNPEVTLRGAGMNVSILSFKGQTGGAEGLIVTGDDTVLKDFAVEDTKGDAIKAKDVNGIAFIRVRAEWTNGPAAENGAYGLYPVSSRNVLIDGAVVKGASDAGIYVGQSQKIIVRNSRGEFNVAGLEIENCYFADVFDNVLTNNTGGLLVFDLPDLPQQGGHDIRFFRNQSFANNTKNFAPEGNIVGLVPAGTGMLVMANSDVEIFDNEFHDNRGVGLILASYVKDTEDAAYDINPRRIHIHNNTFRANGHDPDDSEFGGLLRELFGDRVPQIVWDGVMPVWRYLTVGLASDRQHSIHDNDMGDELPYGNADFIGKFGLTWLHAVSFDASEHSARLAPLAPVQVIIRGRDVSHKGAWAEIEK